MRLLGWIGAPVVIVGWLLALGAVAPSDVPPPTSPKRIVSVAPSITEALFALGAADQVVGVSDYCRYPEAVRGLPRVGGLYNPHLERLAGLAPDVVVTLESQRGLRDTLARLGIAYATVSMNSPSSVPAALEAIGAAAGRPDAGSALRQRVQERVAALLRTVPSGPAKRVLWLFEREPDSLTGMIGLGPSGYLHGLIEMAGGANVLEGAPTAVPSVSVERVIRLAPDVILEHAVFYAHLGEDWQERVSKPWQRLLGDDAIRQGRVRFVTEDAVMSPGPRLPDALALLIDLLHGTPDGG